MCIRDSYRTFQQENADELVTIFPGILDMLRDLKNAGYRLAIVTSRTRESAQRYMDMFGIASYFDDMVSCEDTNVHKPNQMCIRDRHELVLRLEK